MSAPRLAYTVVDAFTSSIFGGNPTAVIVLDPKFPLPDTTLQNIAAEFNLSETAYVTPINPNKGRFGLRWFTPRVEVPLCGHATLASAFVLLHGSTLIPEGVELIEFEIIYSGVLTAKALADGRIELEFPAAEIRAANDSLDRKVREVVNTVFELGSQPSVKFVGTGNGPSYHQYILIEINSDYDLKSARVNPDQFRELAPQYNVIIVTQQSGRGKETFRSRVFAPSAGIPEDPVTGSAHSMLGPYWAKELQLDDESANEIFARQVSARSGELGVGLDRQKKMCRLRGNATLVANGELYLPN